MFVPECARTSHSAFARCEVGSLTDPAQPKLDAGLCARPSNCPRSTRRSPCTSSTSSGNSTSQITPRTRFFSCASLVTSLGSQPLLRTTARMRYTSSPTDVALTSCHSSCGESSACHTSQRGKRAISFSNNAGGGIQNVNSGFQPPKTKQPKNKNTNKNHKTKPTPTNTSSFHLSSFKSSVMGWS